jgi:hypothetical protein
MKEGEKQGMWCGVHRLQGQWIESGKMPSNYLS